MASTYSDLKFELIGTGDQSGTWGNTTNDNIGTAIEQAIVGLGNPIFTTDANLTITLTNTVALQTARALVLNATSTGSLTATRELVVPTIEKQYIVQNNTTGGQSITVKTTAGTGITVPTGRKAHLYVDGVNVIQMFDFVDINGGAVDGTPVGATTASTGAFTTLAASGAVTLSGGTANGVAFLNGSKVLTTGSALTFDGTNFILGANKVIVKNTVGDAQGLQIYQAASDVSSIFNFYNGALAFGVNNAEQMRLTSTGLGIGTSSPSTYSSRLVSVSQTGGAAQSLDAPSGTNTSINWYNNGTAKWATQVLPTGEFRWFDFTAAATRLLLDSSGNLLVGTTNAGSGNTSGRIRIGNNTGGVNGVYSGQSVAGGYAYVSDTISNGGIYYHCNFLEGTTSRGSITSNETITVYATTSDYRLKTVIGPVANAGQRIDALQPVEYTWNANGERTRGFLAHQFQEVYAGSVSGTKDAVDAEGKPVYQSMQASTSEVIADLVAELQSLRARITALESN